MFYDTKKHSRVASHVTDRNDYDFKYGELIGFCKSRKRIFLFGTEQISAYYFELMKKAGIVPYGYIDIDPNKTEIDHRKLPVPFYRYEEVDFQSNASEIGVILSCSGRQNYSILVRLPRDISFFQFMDTSVKLLYDREILYDHLSQMEERSLPFSTAPISEKWAHLRNTFSMLHDDEMSEDNVLIGGCHGRDEIRSISLNDIGIVMQGPIYEEGNFTLETCKFYRSLYPNIPIVVSTWRGGGGRRVRPAMSDNRRNCYGKRKAARAKFS